MPGSVKFEVRFDPDAAVEYESLDNSVRKAVDAKLEELEQIADEVGKPLSNLGHAKLHGCREIKLRKHGIRIIYRIASGGVEVLRVVDVMAISRRADDYVFKLADRRYAAVKKLTPAQYIRREKKLKQWEKSE